MPSFDMSLVDAKSYESRYQFSLQQPETFWKTVALDTLDWMKPFTIVKNVSFQKADFRIRWFEDGELNACYNCVDRHALETPEKVAFYFVPNEPQKQSIFSPIGGEENSEKKHQHNNLSDCFPITYADLKQHVSRFANVLKMKGVQKGDVVSIYMPMIPEAVYAMLACARIGAIHNVVFGGFSANALADRLDDCESKVIVTADVSVRGPKTIILKETVDIALKQSKKQTTKSVIVIKNKGASCPMQEGQDFWYHELSRIVSDECECEVMNAEDPLFILYTSGSTGKPKGVLHTTGGYLTYAAYTHKTVFDVKDNDVYWCTADVGWITGHSYMVYGPLANGVQSVIYEGVPTYPDASRLWQIVDQLNVSLFYTAPTVIRSLMRYGDDFLQSSKRTSLRVLGSVGEPLNPEAWSWYHDIIGHGNASLVDTWWQTETGGILITPQPKHMKLKPGSVAKPFFGISPELLDNEGKVISGEGAGNLVIKASWPGQMRGVYKDQDRFFKTYFSRFPGYYSSEDGARRDFEGYYTITGRVDDIINVSGHRIGTAEVEAVINKHFDVAESAVIGIPHEIKGESLLAFVILKTGFKDSPSLRSEIMQLIARDIGSFAKPDALVFVPGLPKTRSGKIMRRILKKIARKDKDLGDTSTLSDPKVIDQITKALKSG